MFVCLCVCIQCRVEGVQNILCMWGILKVLKCISCPLIVVVEEGCVCVCVCVRVLNGTFFLTASFLHLPLWPSGMQKFLSNNSVLAPS